jgi:uncharacterized membrane protein YedE/YeeE
MKNLVKNVVGYGVALLCIMWGLGVLMIASNFVEWACADNFRFSITFLIGGLLVIRMIIKEVTR